MTEPVPAVLALDPGHRKCGLAVVAADGAIATHVVVAAEDIGPAAARAMLALPADLRVQRIILGDGTRSAEARAQLAAALPDLPIDTVNETGSTLAARDRYWREHPPRGLWRLVPTSLRVPPEPYDDWVAVLLGERYWAGRANP